MHGVHNLPDNLSLTENALVGEKMKTLLLPMKDDATPWRYLILDLGWNCTHVLEPLPVVAVASGMREGSTVGFRLCKRSGVNNGFTVKKPEDADARLWSTRIFH